MQEKPGWYSRGYLPHFDVPNLVQFITFRLADSIPKSATEKIEAEVALLAPEKREAARRVRLNKWLDRGFGSCWLKQPAVAKCVEETLLASDGSECKLLSWCIMPNHVHVLAELRDEVLLSDLIKKWKGSSATEANRILGRRGTFWFREYWDRYMRDAKHLADTTHYIDQNPVKAGLVEYAADWRYGSARLGADYKLDAE